MVAGVRPFAGATEADVIAAILDKEPPPLKESVPEAPGQIEQIVSRALRKDREERYQTADEMLRDLDALKQELELDAHLRRRQPVRAREGRSLLASLRRHHRVALASLAALIVLAAALIAFFNRKPVLTDKDTVLLADFTNTTGDAVFDGALKQALAVQLEQSPYLSLFPEQQARQTLRLMNRKPSEPLSGETAREVCQRNGIKALLGGAIAPIGSHYVITLEAINAASGDVIARQLAQAGSKEQVLKSLGQAATELRAKLGESLASIQKFDKPLEQVTTSSLDALKAYSQGLEQRMSGNESSGIPFYNRAIELDPNFARAYASLATAYFNLHSYEQAAQFSDKAYSLRDRVSERENFYITQQYFYFVFGDIEKRTEVQELLEANLPARLSAALPAGQRLRRYRPVREKSGSDSRIPATQPEKRRCAQQPCHPTRQPEPVRGIPKNPGPGRDAEAGRIQRPQITAGNGVHSRRQGRRAAANGMGQGKTV
jgi:tetratricopeptide (TPR) repeat protein